MMSERCYVCADAAHGRAIAEVLRRERPSAILLPVEDSWTARTALLAELPGTSSVVVGAGCRGVEPVNLASALVRDGHAREVALVAEQASGSLRSRARKAGVDRVIDQGEITGAVRAGGAGRLAEGSVPGPSARTAPAAERESPTGGGLGPRQTAAEGACSRRQAPPARARDENHAAGSARPLTSTPQPPHACPILCFASGRGGVGKTAAVVTTAHVLAGWGMHVAVCDLDLSFGNAFSFLGLDGPADISSLAGQGDGWRERCIRCGRRAGEGVSVWGPCSEPELAETVTPLTSDLLACLSNEFDVVLVDTSSDWGDEVAAAAQICDRLVLVADERAGAVGSLARAGSLAVRLGVARTRIVRLMNRCDRRRRDEGFLARADVGLETARSFRVLDGGDEVSEILSAGHADELARLEGDYTQSIATFSAQILSELGRLPDCDEARKALQGGKRRGRSFMGLRREAS